MSQMNFELLVFVRSVERECPSGERAGARLGTSGPDSGHRTGRWGVIPMPILSSDFQQRWRATRAIAEHSSAHRGFNGKIKFSY